MVSKAPQNPFKMMINGLENVEKKEKVDKLSIHNIYTNTTTSPKYERSTVKDKIEKEFESSNLMK